MKTKLFALLAVFIMSFMAFNFLTTPTVPSLTSPSDGASSISRTPTLDWEVSSGQCSITYDVQVATTESFDGGTIKVDQSGISQTDYTVTQQEKLPAITMCFWKVRACCESCSDWSEVRYFTTGNY